jgi:voltage-gated potassium channel
MAPEQPVKMGERITQWTKSRQQRRGLRPRDAAMLIAFAWFAAILLFGFLERLLDPKTFHTIWLGDWWALQTVTTVGYGDVVPQTSMGRLVASVLLLGGLAFLTVIIAMITGGFVALYQRQAIAAGEDPYIQAMERITAELREVREELTELRSTGASSGPRGPSGAKPPLPGI